MCRHQNWLSWSVTSVAGYIGWVPGRDAPTQPAAPTDEDIQGLYKDLDFDPQAHENLSRPAGSAFGIKASMHVSMPSRHKTVTLPVRLCMCCHSFLDG